MMVLLAAVALAATPPADSGPRPVVAQATATVRIISGVRLKLDSATNRDAPTAHDSKVMTDGTTKPARLIEFE